MQRIPAIIILLVTGLTTQTIGANGLSPDSTETVLNLNARAFFDNKEFTGDIKKGYTLPGFFIEPTLLHSGKRYRMAAGFHLLYMAGCDSVERIVPILSISTKLNEHLKLTVGTLNRDSRSALPEALYKPERMLNGRPETGISFSYSTAHTQAEMWINWERFIRNGSPFQEEFTYGLLHQYSTREMGYIKGITFRTIALAFHKGGQIDATNLPVTTVVNLSEAIELNFPLSTNSRLIPAISAYLSSDKSPTPHLPFRNGTALHPRIGLRHKKVQIEAGYWFSNSFTNPRGEELFGSVSTIGAQLNEKERKLITLAASVRSQLENGLLISGRFALYYDLKKGLPEYCYTLTLTFDKKLFRFRE